MCSPSAGPRRRRRLVHAGSIHSDDVSMYPGSSDLILASDLLVTDFSSISFDYYVTGKPMYFLVLTPASAG